MPDHTESRVDHDGRVHRALRRDLAVSLSLTGLFLVALVALWVADSQSGAISAIVRQLWG